MKWRDESSINIAKDTHNYNIQQFLKHTGAGKQFMQFTNDRNGEFSNMIQQLNRLMKKVSLNKNILNSSTTHRFHQAWAVSSA